MSNRLAVAPLGDLEIVMTRTFDAPRNLVFDAWTKPELLKQWLGVRNGWHFAECIVDLRAGGRYRYVWRKESNGKQLASGGVFKEVVPPERYVCTEAFEDEWYAGESLVTTAFEERGGATVVTMTMAYESAKVRDMVLNSGMDSGVSEGCVTLDRLMAEWLVTRAD